MAARISRDDLYVGGIFVAIGAYFSLEALTYDLGSLIRMGPGFAPLMLGSVLVALGLAIAIKGLREPREASNDPPSWRAIGLIVVTIAFFGFSIRGLGFVPTVFISAAVTAMASRETRPLGALIIATGLTLLSTLVFVFGLRMSVPIFGPWLGM